MSTKAQKPYSWEKNAKTRAEIVGGKRVDLTPERKKYIIESIQNLAAGLKAMDCSALISVNFNDDSGPEEGITALVGSKSQLNEMFSRMQDLAKDPVFDETTIN